MRPLVAVTTWKRTTDTFLGPDTPLHTLVHNYTDRLDRAGAATVLVAHFDPADTDTILDRVDGLVVTGGGDFDPETYGQENTESVRIEPTHDVRDLDLIRGARRRGMPVLGICRGHQALNIAFGGSMSQHSLADDNEAHPTLDPDAEVRNIHRHVVTFDPDSRLYDIYGSVERKVNSLHHQAVTVVGDGLAAVGHSSDGAIEAVESIDPDWRALGVQWHPEMMEDVAEDAIFDAFVIDARAFSDR